MGKSSLIEVLNPVFILKFLLRVKAENFSLDMWLVDGLKCLGPRSTHPSKSL